MNQTMEPVGKLNLLMWSTVVIKTICLNEARQAGEFLVLIHERVPGKIIGHYEFLTEIYMIFFVLQ